MFLHILMFPLLAGLIAQSIKFFIRSNNQKFKFKNMVAYSGMPSGHSAMIVALATIVGLEESFHSSLFAMSCVLAVIVIRDAVGIRRYLGEHGRTLNILVKDLDEDKFLDNKYPKLLEKIGHTPAQVLVGSILGFLVSFVGHWLIS
jgi:uncharacterized protein